VAAIPTALRAPLPVPVTVTGPVTIDGPLPAPAPVDDSALRNLDATLAASHAYIDAQVATASGLDAKLVGLLAVYGAAIAPVIAVVTTVSHLGASATAGLATLAVCLALNILLSVCSLLGVDDVRPGPRPRKFFYDFGGNPSRDYMVQLLEDLDAAIADNDRDINLRRQLTTISILLFVGGLVGAGAVAVLV
jgi:hypothetical protein